MARDPNAGSVMLLMVEGVGVVAGLNAYSLLEGRVEGASFGEND